MIPGTFFASSYLTDFSFSFMIKWISSFLFNRPYYYVLGCRLISLIVRIRIDVLFVRALD